MRATINSLYQYSKTNSLPLLGSSNFDFWASYVSGYNVFDRYFRDKFLSWFYWLNFDESTGTADIYSDFVEAVESFLTINNKRYSELYRVQVLAADAYDIVNNYDLTETHTNTHSTSTSDTYGQRTDTNTSTSTEGAREDSTSTTTVDGARSDSGSTTVGTATNTSEKEIAGFNSSNYSDADKQTDIFGSHTDSTSVSKGAQTNTNNTTLNKGAQNNSTSGSVVKGSETDSHSTSGSETINIHRTGNIGVQTAADVIGGHIQLWTTFNFYKMVFDEIAKEFLLLDQCYDNNSGGTVTNENIIMEELKKLEAKINLTAKSSELTGLAKSSELSGLAKSSELTGLAKSSELTGLAKSSELTGLAKSSELTPISLSIEALRASTLSYKNDIIGSIEGVSTDEY